MSYLKFEDAGASDSGKTQRFRVIGSDGVVLGGIYWFAHWRKYTFQPIGSPVFDAVCLREIADYAEKMTLYHKAKQ